MLICHLLLQLPADSQIVRKIRVNHEWIYVEHDLKQVSPQRFSSVLVAV